MNNFKSIFVLMAVFLSVNFVTSCSKSQIRQSMGLKKDAPDEFLVQRRDKLKIPQEIDLPSPELGTKSKQSVVRNQAKKLLLTPAENKKTKLSELEEVIYNKVEASDNIREVVSDEYNQRKNVLGVEQGGLAESILDPFGYNRSTAKIIDGAKENERIRKAISQGKAISIKDTKVLND